MKNSGQFQKGQKPWNFGKKASVEAKRKMSEAHIGLKMPPFSDKHKQRISKGQKDRVQSPETRKKISEAKKYTSPETRLKMSQSKIGRVLSDKTRGKMSEAHRGQKSYSWKGGITPQNLIIRRSLEYRLWRESVFLRDKYTCCGCNQKGGKLNAHHIKAFHLYPHLRFAIDNGETLCEQCHKKTHSMKKAN